MRIVGRLSRIVAGDADEDEGVVHAVVAVVVVVGIVDVRTFVEHGHPLLVVVSLQVLD